VPFITRTRGQNHKNLQNYFLNIFVFLKESWCNSGGIYYLLIPISFARVWAANHRSPDSFLWPFFPAGSRCSPSWWCHPQGLGPYLDGLFSSFLEGSTSMPTCWCWLMFYEECALYNPIFSWFLPQQGVGESVVGWCCWWCQAFRSELFFWDKVDKVNHQPGFCSIQKHWLHVGVK